MSGPAWLAGSFAVLMVVIAAYCACRLAVARLRGGDTELDTDGLHVLMGAAMAGMLEPRLTPVPGTAWRAVFAAAAAWFAWQAIRPGGRAGRARCAHPAPHAVECAVMVYMSHQLKTDRPQAPRSRSGASIIHCSRSRSRSRQNNNRAMNPNG